MDSRIYISHKLAQLTHVYHQYYAFSAHWLRIAFLFQIAGFISLIMIVSSIASFCIETMKITKSYAHIFDNLEYVYCIFFTFEFILRAFSCPSHKKFVKSLMTWIDFLSTVQFYINFIFPEATTSQSEPSWLEILIVLRLARIFRLFRFFTNFSGMQVIGQTLKASAHELCLLVFLMLMPMVVFSTLVYYAEVRIPSNNNDNR